MIKSKGLLSALSDIKIKEKAVFVTTSLTLLFISGWLAQYSSNAFEFVATSQVTYPFYALMPSLKQTNSQQQLLEANTLFGLRLFQTLVSEDPNQNVFVSPPSVAIALSILMQGANGKTREEMVSTLGYEELNVKEIHTTHQILLNSLQQDNPNLDIALANALYARDGISFRHQFLKDNELYYQSQITNLNFASPQAAGIINRWTREHTQGKIDQIVPHINPKDTLIVVNAIYFKGMWKHKFDRQQTKNQPFYLPNGKTKQYPLMSGKGKYQYYENEQFQAVNLPYGDERFSLYIFLPKSGSNLSSLLSQLTFQRWNEWIQEFNVKQGSLQIPRFTIEYESNLKQALSTLGMKSIFSQGDFSNMTSSAVVVNEIKHKTLVEVKEEGIEPPSSTSPEVEGKNTFTMIVNRPFFCAIRDQEKGIVLFMGAIVDPN
ncbi:proteinase inhibitor I4 serpin [Gloeothece citriformis PCC 7424]|uniref:Proteinase inhibitor I4 serpin n=1 Tax=Gloeothece citriformis (strain PCC 7424) TaxID=65393 RepID=B7KEY4_GLOC7|nr:serpin family protein [Gloeothece citriformis]ACK70440.1 proteinase inhibitor I4 serpin [Gloeothece citriformis PCC 7424]